MTEKKEETDQILSEIEIDVWLDQIINKEGIFENPSKIIKVLATLIFNLRYDLTEFKDMLYNAIVAVQKNKQDREENLKDYGGYVS